MSLTKKNLLLLTMVVILAIIPLIFNSGAEFGGADGAAEEMITVLHPDYEPWFQSIWEPPSGEIESLLFALQAAIGAGFIAYFFGYQKGKKNAGR
ncbi:energy-coupling factor ABC transporter substrate-binding protein [Clostridiaceae bacterium 35-E11]